MLEPIILRPSINVSNTNTNANDYFAQAKNNRNQTVAKDSNNINQSTQNKSETEENTANNSKEVKANEEKKDNKVKDIKDIMSEIPGIDQVYFKFEYSEDNPTEMIMKVVDKITDEVVNQYPSDVSLKIMKMIEKIIGRGQLSDVSV